MKCCVPTSSKVWTTEWVSLKSNDVKGNVVKCWCKVGTKKEFKQIVRLSILLLTVQPDICDLGRGFSVMNKVKNEYRAKLKQENLYAAAAIAMKDTEYKDSRKE